ncbi:MAG TPA: MFS transporter [Roseiarcus sp.]|jgi:predicted MFS family arabinose efflux permease
MPSSRPRLSATFARLAWSNLSAQGSEQMALAAGTIVAVLALGADGAETGLLQTAQTLPFLLLALPAGILADRVSRRGLMVCAEATRALSLALILALIVSARLNLALLAALGFLGAAGTVAYSVAAPAMVPLLAPRELLTSANRWIELARSGAFAAGPAIGGALVGWSGAPAAFVVATALSLFAVSLLMRLPDAKANRAAQRRHPIHELQEGLRFVVGHSLLRPLLIVAVIFNLSWFVLQAVYAPYAVRHMGLGATGLGATLGAYGAGMIVGALGAPALERFLSFGAMIVVGPLCGFLASLLMAATITAPSPWLAGLSFFLFGMGPIVWVITTTALRQTVTPNAMLGRVSAIIVTATFGARPAGAAIGAAISAGFGVEACLVVSAVGFFLQFAAILGSAPPRLRALPAE